MVSRISKTASVFFNIDFSAYIYFIYKIVKIEVDKADLIKRKLSQNLKNFNKKSVMPNLDNDIYKS